MPDAMAGKIGGDVREAFACHLETCAACKKEFSEMREIYDYLDVQETGSADVIPIEIYHKQDTRYVRGNWMKAALFLAVFISMVAIGSQFRRIGSSFVNAASKRITAVDSNEKKAEKKRAGGHVKKESETASGYSDPYVGETDSMLGSCFSK
jgi:hypothetical protein